MLFSSRAISTAARLASEGYFDMTGPSLTAKGRDALSAWASSSVAWKRTLRDLSDDVKRGWITSTERDKLAEKVASAETQWQADAIRNEYLTRKGF
jgi:hypothetical protein